MSHIMSLFSWLSPVCLALAGAVTLSACASITDTPNQQVQVLTPGATGARCVLSNDYVKYAAHPPETIQMRRMQEPLKITCMAPGNRERTTFAYATKNGAAWGNVITGGVSAIYDHFSGALYEYPSPISVDFRHTIATNLPLPGHYAPDTTSPHDQKLAPMRGQPTHPPFGEFPASLIEVEAEQDTEEIDDSEKPEEMLREKPVSSKPAQK